MELDYGKFPHIIKDIVFSVMYFYRGYSTIDFHHLFIFVIVVFISFYMSSCQLYPKSVLFTLSKVTPSEHCRVDLEQTIFRYEFPFQNLSDCDQCHYLLKEKMGIESKGHLPHQGNMAAYSPENNVFFCWM